MWFRNLCPYRFREPFRLDAETLEARLAEHAFRPCGRTEPMNRGWDVPAGSPGGLVYAAGGRLLLGLREETRLLPASVIRDTVSERLESLEAREGRPPSRREKTRLKDEAILELLPRAFTRSRWTLGYIDPGEGWLVVDAATWKEAETFTEHLRAGIGSLPVAPLQTLEAPQSVMTRWLAQARLPADLALGDEAVLEDTGNEGGEVRCKRLDLTSGEVRTHLEAGRRVRRLAVSWEERLDAVLEADLSVRRLRFRDVIQEQSGNREPETDAERFDADFALMSLELARFLPRLVELFGGESTERRQAAGRG